MRRSRQQLDMIGAEHSAPQHEHAPRPLPLFLQLVQDLSAGEPGLARDALKGLALYSSAARSPPADPRPEIARQGAACLRDHGGAGQPVVLVPSLINPPHILDLDEEVSLTRAIAGMGFRALLLDWGDVGERRGLSVSGHVEQLLLPLLEQIGEPPVLLGYCLGGTMAIAAAGPGNARAVVTLAAPWHFSHYPDDGRAALQRLWRQALPGSSALGVLPLEVLQASFWSLDPERTVRKFAELKDIDPASPKFRRFVALEDWANAGDPLPLPAARELVEDLFRDDLSGRGLWEIGGQAATDRLRCRALHFTAARDRITPAETAAEGVRREIASGHVGMVVGRARHKLHRSLADFLEPCR